jgi:hypothetical protein
MQEIDYLFIYYQKLDIIFFPFINHGKNKFQ